MKSNFTAIWLHNNVLVEH